MKFHCNSLTHPLRHAGTNQRDRLLTSLIPGQLQIDDRSLEDLIAFAGTLSRHIRFWDENNMPSGDWLPFWESDATSLLAIIAATDTETIRIGYRSKELQYYRRKKTEKSDGADPEKPSSAIADELVADPGYGIYALAKLIRDICGKTPEDHPLKKEIINLISSTLREPLYRLIQFHKSIDEDAISQYEGFIGSSVCAAPWGLPDNAAFECIDFVLPYEHVEELWKLFLHFYKSLLLILEKARRAFHSSLRIRQDHEPHITLFISFLQLFKYLQQDLNSLTEKHLLHYYHDILRLERRRLMPDKVHVVFEIAANLTRYKLADGLELKAGADLTGRPMTYKLFDELVISKARLVEKQNLYITETIMNDRPVLSAIVLKAADKRDGIDEDWPEGAKEWSAFSGMDVYNRLFYKHRQLLRLENDHDRSTPAIRMEMQKLATKLEQLKAFSGFSISSASLWLNSGATRTIDLTFDFDDDPEPDLMDLYKVEISTVKGLIVLKRSGTDGMLLADFIKSIDRMVNITKDEDPEFSSSYVFYKDNEGVYHIVLFNTFPSVLPLEDGEWPFIRFRSNDVFDHNTPQIINVGLQCRVDPVSLSLLRKDDSPPGLYRINGDILEAGEQILLASGQNKGILLLVPELSVKTPQTLRVMVRAANLEMNGFDFSFKGNWITVNGYGIFEESLTETESDTIPVIPRNPDAFSPKSNGLIRISLNAGGEIPVLLKSEDIFVGYETNKIEINGEGNNASKKHFISYFTSLGDWMLNGTGDFQRFRPNPRIEMPSPQQSFNKKMFNAAEPAPVANGNCFLGFENIVPGQTLSVLFEMSEGSGNPDHYAPAIEWSYLVNDNWVGLPPQFILKDTTLGMQQTGIIVFRIPDDINNNNTWILGKDGRKDLYWLRAAAVENEADKKLVDALPMLIDIHLHAGIAEFDDNNNSEGHLEAGLPARRISSPRFKDVNIKTVTQPYPSFDGRRSELADMPGYIRRIHERIRHKHRAVTIWDYERLVLEAFPKVSLVKCLSHSRRIYTVRPGHVTLAVIPSPEKMQGNRKYYPILNTGDLTAIKNYLAKRNSYFVGGYGDPEFCCCEDGCKCDHHTSRLDVINAVFEPVRLKICVRFIEGKDIPYYRKELNEVLKNFLAPWANDSQPLAFGISISLTRLLQFLENLDYVDVIMSLKVKHFASRQMGDYYANDEDVDWEEADEIIPFTAASVLTTYLDRLNEDNPNVVDHEINVVPLHDRCSCDGCKEDEEDAGEDPIEELRDEDGDGRPDLRVRDRQEAIVANLGQTLKQLWDLHPNSVPATLADFVIVLQEQIANGILRGTAPEDPEQGREGTHAYTISRETGQRNRILGLWVGLAFAGGDGSFTKFFVNKPDSN